MFVDTHSHIYAEEFDNDRTEVIQRALEADVRQIILPDIDSTTRQSMLSLAEALPDMMYPTLGVHPTSVNESYKTEIQLFEKLLGQETIYGIGECGIDLYWDKTFYKEQVIVFERQLNIAREMDLGFLLGIGGVVTFKKSSMAEVVGKIGTEYLVLETDAPYLAPVPYRGKRNESSYIPCIAAKIAEILGVDTKKVEETTTNNAMNLFNLHINSANRS